MRRCAVFSAGPGSCPTASPARAPSPPFAVPFPVLLSSMARPLIGPIGDVFGPSGNRFHAGLDFPAPKGAAVGAARSGRVDFAGWGGNGWGNMVVIAHGSGVRTLYAHLSRIAVRVGKNVGAGSTIGFVGASGRRPARTSTSR